MRRLFCFFSIFFWCSLGWSQTPTLVQTVWGPNSMGAGSGNGNWLGSPVPYYAIEFPEPTQAGNLLVCSSFSGNSGGYTLSASDDKSETWRSAGSNFPFISASGDHYDIWYVANNVGGVRQVKVTSSDANGAYVAVTCSEFYNVATSSPTDGTANCHTINPGTTLTGTATGALTSGDLIYFVSFNDYAESTASFTAGSQSNITWNLDAVDLLDGYAVQHGVYSTTTSFTPQMTTGTSNTYTSCEVMFKAASAGTAPTQSMRIVHLGHFAMPASGTTQTVQIPSSGNLLVASFTGGGDSISGITSTPSNEWSSTGAVAGGASFTASSQIYYAANANTATNSTVAITRTGTLSQDTVLIYDITGANTSPFDSDSGGQDGNQTFIVSSFTTCGSCLTPATGSGIAILNANQNWCTGTTQTSPFGAVFDSAFTTFNSVNGPQNVDQNGEWAHFYYTSTSPITATWTMSCGATNAEATWAGRVATFKAAQFQSSVTLVSSVNPSAFGEAVTFTARVTSATSETPTGTVTFKDGATTLDTTTLSAGEAAFTTATLDLGVHSVTAVYGGGTDVSGSTSSVLKQTVATAAQEPEFSPGTGTYTSKQTVIITDTTPDATIYYTTNGTTPTTSSTKYTGVITVPATETLRAIAVATEYTNSAIATAKYTITPHVATPVFSVAAGVYTSTQSVTITDATTGATIYYTTNGATPTTASTKYTRAIIVPVTETIEAMGVVAGYTNSAVATAKYTIVPLTATPVISPNAGIYSHVESVTITDATPGAVIYYTTHGTAPTETSAKYTGAIAIDDSEKVETIALATGYTASAVAAASYTLIGSPSALAAPATAVSTSDATLNALVNTLGVTGSYIFQYGTWSTALTSSTPPTTLSASTIPVAAAAKLTTLQAKTTYHYRVVVTTVGGTSSGSILSFTTN